MFRLVVLCALANAIVAVPSYNALHSAALSTHHYQPSAYYSYPAATSYQQRTDIVSNPVPVVHQKKIIVAAPQLVAAPVQYKTVLTAPALHSSYSSYGAPWTQHGSYYGAVNNGVYGHGGYGSYGSYGSYAAQVPSLQAW